jgi:hypothetical protein
MRYLSAVLILFMVFACAHKYHAYQPGYGSSNPAAVPDYSDLHYWAAHPWKTDPSDSIPSALKTQKTDSLADVFFLYPTTYITNKEGWNANINDAYINAKTDYSTILYQASVFNQHCRIFSPRYRQAHFSAFFSTQPDALAAFDTAYADLRLAFEYYLEHYNNGRPIIIAGHSQGAKMCERLLKDFFDGRLLQQKLIAAYIIGWPVPQNFFSAIPACDSATQTGCFCSWRTFRKNYIPEYINEENPIAEVTNPLSWTKKTDHVSRMENNGSVLKNFNKIILHTTDAQIHNGVLWVNKPKFPGAFLYRTRNYHIADINLFYINLRQNIEDRINTYFNKK